MRFQQGMLHHNYNNTVLLLYIYYIKVCSLLTLSTVTGPIRSVQNFGGQLYFSVFLPYTDVSWVEKGRRGGAGLFFELHKAWQDIEMKKTTTVTLKSFIWRSVDIFEILVLKLIFCWIWKLIICDYCISYDICFSHWESCFMLHCLSLQSNVELFVFHFVWRLHHRCTWKRRGRAKW